MCLAVSFDIVKKDPWIWIKWIRIGLWANIIIGIFFKFYGSFVGHADIIVSEEMSFDANVFAWTANITLLIEIVNGARRDRQNYLLIFILITINFLMFSRQGILGLSLVLILWSVVTHKINFSSLAGVGILVVLFIYGSSILTDRFSELIEMEDIARHGRWKMFLRGFYLFIDNPIFGIGVGNFYRYRYAYEGLITTGRWGDSHNLYAQIGAETGIIGLVILILYINYSYKNIKKLSGFYPLLSRLGFGLILLYFCEGLFYTVKYDFVLLFPMLSISWIGAELDKNPKINSINSLGLNIPTK